MRRCKSSRCHWVSLRFAPGLTGECTDFVCKLIGEMQYSLPRRRQSYRAAPSRGLSGPQSADSQAAVCVISVLRGCPSIVVVTFIFIE